MRLDPVELSRLAAVQRAPTSHIERRVEHLALVDDYHYAATVTQQMTMPRLASERGIRHVPRRVARRLSEHDEKTAPPNRLLPLGWFPKDRLPDLAVVDEQGTQLPVLTRDDQGRVASYVFLTRWESRVFVGFSKEQEKLETLWGVIGTAVERIVTSSPEGAYLVIYRLHRFLETRHRPTDTPSGTSSDAEARFASALLDVKEFWEALAQLARVRLLVARMPTRLEQTFLVRISYTESFDYMTLRPIGVVRRVRSRFRHGLRWLGLIGLSVTREASNVGHSRSLWVIFTAPPGLEAVRCFWRSERQLARSPRISLDVSKAAVGRHAGRAEPTSDATVLDLQLAPTPDVFSAALISAVLSLVAAYLFKTGGRYAKGGGDDPSPLLALASLFVAAPAGVAGAIAFRGATIVRRAGNGPRFAIVLLTIQAALLALAVGLRQPAGLTEGLGYVVAVYSFTASGLFLMIRFAPRWRRNDRSRRPRLTRKTPPATCRGRQLHAAVTLFIVWLALIAGCAYALDSHHHGDVLQELGIAHSASHPSRQPRSDRSRVR